jgi:hypothetical protein
MGAIRTFTHQQGSYEGRRYVNVRRLRRRIGREKAGLHIVKIQSLCTEKHLV